MKSKVLGSAISVLSCCLYAANVKAADKITKERLYECRDDLKLTSKDGRDVAARGAAPELEKADCEQPDVYCVDATGYPFDDDVDPRLKTGQRFTVKLFGPASCEGVLTVGTDVKQSDIRLFREEPAAPPRSASKRNSAKDVKIQLLAKATLEIGALDQSVKIVVSRVDQRISVTGIELGVTPPRYFLDVGLLVAFAPAYQTVTTYRAPGSTEVFIREKPNIHPAAAVTINYFPCGQYAVPRFSGLHGLGFQAGIGADFDRIDDEFYLGAIWEPVPGAGISAGLGLLMMEKLHPDYPEGSLVEPNDVPKDEFLGPRFYFGVSLNTHVFQTVLRLGEKAIVPN